jgi:hypothetical protein
MGVARTALQACSIDHSDISPFRINAFERSETVDRKGSFKGDGPPMRFVISSLRTHSKSFGAEIV